MLFDNCETCNFFFAKFFLTYIVQFLYQKAKNKRVRKCIFRLQKRIYQRVICQARFVVKNYVRSENNNDVLVNLGR